MAVPQQGAALRYVPGPWVCVAGPDVVLLADLDPAAPIVTALWHAADSGAGVDDLLGVILREGLRTVPSFVIAARTGAGMRVLVSGKARAEINAPGAEPTVLDAAHAPTWLERAVAEGAGARLVAEPVPTPVAGPLPLQGGVVLAGAVVLGDVDPGRADEPVVPDAMRDVVANAETQVERPIPPPPAAAEPGPPAGDTMQPEPQRASGLIDSLPWLGQPPAPPTTQQPPAAPTTQQPPAPPTTQQPPAPPTTQQPIEPIAVPKPDRAAPTVLAVACPNRHLGPPYSGTCRVCGAPVPPQDPFTAPRPVLGVLNISTGAMVPLDRDVVLGRAPSAADAEPQSRPHLVQLASPGNDISRNHVRVGIEGWHVLVTDLGSTNGTVVTLPGQQPVRLRSHDAFTIVPGTTVNLADEVNVRFDVPI